MKLNILIIIFFLLGLYGCSGDQTRSSDPEFANKKKVKVVAKKEQKKVDEMVVNTEASLDDDFAEPKDQVDETLDEEDIVEDEEIVDEDNTENTASENEEDANSGARIKNISFEPKVIRADKDIKVFAHIVPGPTESETILYSFIRNGTVLAAPTNNEILKKGQFRKGDLIAVNVIIEQDGDVKEEKRTELNKVDNTNPKITSLPSISVSGFKTYTFTVVAEDIDEDSITYELEGDIPPGMTIDMFTGKITYVFNEKPEDKTFVFNIIAADPDGGKDIKEITIGFKEETVKNN